MLSKATYKLLSYCMTVITIALIIAGCGDNARVQALGNSIKDMKETAEKSTRPVAEANLQFPTAIQYTANDTTLNNNDQKNNGTNAVAGVAINALQAYPVNKYQFVGVLDEQHRLSAYLLAPDGQMYQVKEGDVIGINHGKISKIDADHLTVIESSGDQNMKAEQHSIILELKDGANEQS